MLKVPVCAPGQNAGVFKHSSSKATVCRSHMLKAVYLSPPRHVALAKVFTLQSVCSRFSRRPLPPPVTDRANRNMSNLLPVGLQRFLRPRVGICHDSCGQHNSQLKNLQRVQTSCISIYAAEMQAHNRFIPVFVEYIDCK